MQRSDSKRPIRPIVPLSTKKAKDVLDERDKRYDPNSRRPARPSQPTNVRRPRDITEDVFETFDPVDQHHPLVGKSGPSAAAAARRNEYAPRPAGQSKYPAESSSPGNRNNGSSFRPKTNCFRLPKEAYRPGMIVRAAIHEPNLDQIGRSSITIDRSVTETFYGLVTSKMRKLIVIALYDDHYTAIPLYTHNGHGLSRKAKPNEYVSVRDHRRRGPFNALSVHKALVTEQLKPDVDLFDPVTTAHLTYSVSRPYILPVVHEGFLESASTEELIELIGMFNFIFNSQIVFLTFDERWMLRQIFNMLT